MFLLIKQILYLENLNNIIFKEIEKNQDFCLEYYYRLARVGQKLEDNNVIELFSKVLTLKDKSSLYYHPMSALQIGVEYEQRGDKDKAVIFYKKTLSYSGFNYENGIKKSAKAALDRILN